MFEQDRIRADVAIVWFTIMMLQKFEYTGKQMPLQLRKKILQRSISIVKGRYHDIVPLSLDRQHFSEGKYLYVRASSVRGQYGDVPVKCWRRLPFACQACFECDEDVLHVARCV